MIPGSLNQIYSFRATHMNDMQVTADLACELQSDADGEQFRLDRTGLQIIPPPVLPLTSALFGQGVGHEIILGMNGDRQIASGGNLHSLLKYFRVRMRKIAGATSAHESLKPDRAGIRHFLHCIEVDRLQTAPKPEVQY